MEEKIRQALISATDEIFLEWQAKLHVVSGDNDPWTVNMFDHMVDELARQMTVMLLQQPKLGVVRIEMLDGQVVDLSKVTMASSIVSKLADIEQYLREKELI